jgi:tetratricopeptide (TPR) repeat protein
MLAAWLGDQPDPDEAEVLRYITAAQASSDRPGAATEFLCYLLRTMGRADEAAETNLAAIRATPGAPWLAGGQALARLLSPYTREAERRALRRRAHEAYLAAAPLTAKRRLTAAWFHVGSSDPVVRDPELALELIEPAMTEDQLATLDPDDVRDAWDTLGIIQYLLGRDTDAIRSMESALRLGEEADDEWAARELVVALALHRLGREEQARPWYQRALALREPPEDRNPFWGELDYLWEEGEDRFGEG